MVSDSSDTAGSALYQTRFGALGRVYGTAALDLLAGMHVCIVGVGGVGSWTAESLARSGVGTLTLIDPDDVALSNTNRQLIALDDTVGVPKVDVLADRIAGINPDCRCLRVEDTLVENNLSRLITADFDYVVDAIDSIRFKAALIHYCRRQKIPIITTGGAGGRRDPLAVSISDLSRTWNDALAAKVRSRLRADYGFTKNPKRRFAVECVFSSEQPRYPSGDGGVSHARPGIKGVDLDCEQGYGSASFVTGVFGLVAASRVVNRVLEQRLERQR